jgi:hypothetical protein
MSQIDDPEKSARYAVACPAGDHREIYVGWSGWPLPAVAIDAELSSDQAMIS